MLLFRRATDDHVRRYLASVAGAPFTYANVGCTRDGAVGRPPRGWNRDQERVIVGQGKRAFQAAVEAVRNWVMFPATSAELCWPDAPVEPGSTVVVRYRTWPISCWMLFPARIVYVIDETIERDGHTIARFGFAYGTIAAHPERGEERFLVEHDLATDEVSYDLLAVSQPASWLARLGYPYTRYEQRRFRLASCADMQRYVREHAASIAPPTNVPAQREMA